MIGEEAIEAARVAESASFSLNLLTSFGVVMKIVEFNSRYALNGIL